MAKAVSASKKKLVNKESKYFEYLVLSIIAIILLIAPFYRGLYFRENYIPATLFISLIFAAYLMYKHSCKGYKVIDTYLDLAIIAIPICYLISFFFGVNAKDGLDQILIYSSYFMLYKIVSDTTKEYKNRRVFFINAIIAIIFFIALSSILSLFNLITIKGAVVGNRLFGPYQYPNTTASILGVGIVLTLNALIDAEKLTYRLIYQAILTTLLSTFVFALSRGGFIALGIILFLNFIIINAKEKIKFILNMLISALASSVTIFMFYGNAEVASKNMMLYYLLSILICLIISPILYAITRKTNFSLENKKINIMLVTTILIFVVIIVFLFSAKEPVEYKIEHLKDEKKTWKNKAVYVHDIQPESVYTLEFNVKSSLENQYSYGVIIRSYNAKDEYEEIYKEFNPVSNEYEKKQIEFTTIDDSDRILMLFYNYETDSYTIYKDIVVKDSEGDIVKKIERFKYIPDAISNRLMDINLKTDNALLRIYFTKDGLKLFKDYIVVGAGGGAWKNLYRQYQSLPYNTTEAHNFYIQYAAEVGLLGLIPLILLFVQIAIAFIKGIKNKSNYVPIYLAVLLILMHSSIDFNLSLAASAYFLWVLVGVLNTDDKIMKLNISNTKVLYTGTLALSIVIIIMTSSIYYGINIGNKAAQSTDLDHDQTAVLFEKAMKFDKFNASYRVDYAQIMSLKYVESNDVKYYKSMIEQIGKSNKYEAYNNIYMPTIINLMLKNGLIDEAVSLVNFKVISEPMYAQWYTQKIDINYEIAKHYFSNNEHAKAIPYLENMIKAKEEYDEANARALRPIKLPKDYNMKTDLAHNHIEWAKKIESKKKK